MSDMSRWGSANRGVLMVETPASEQPGLPTSPICWRATSSRLGCWDTRELEYWESVILAYWHYSPRQAQGTDTK